MSKTVYISGGLGFIGSNLVRHLNARGITPIIYDQLDSVGDKWRNVAGLSFDLRDWMMLDGIRPEEEDPVLIHLGAYVDTTAPFTEELWRNNVARSVRLFKQWGLSRIIYASSAAVYGAEETDFTERLGGLTPLNPYAFTKLCLDNVVFGASSPLKEWPIYGLRLFNCFGPNESHKGEMASVAHKALSKLVSTDPYGKSGIYSLNNVGGYRRTKPHWSLFKSHRPDIADGEQRRDFVSVDDVCSVICHFALSSAVPQRGLYNVGTGVARSFKELVSIVDPSLEIAYCDMPVRLQSQYQYRTCADLTKLRAAGYNKPFMTLEEGIERMRTMTT